MNTEETLGRRLSQLRKEKGLSQQELAEKLYVTRQAVSRWELDSAVPTLENLDAISKALGVPLNSLMGDRAAQESVPQEDPMPNPADREEKPAAFPGRKKGKLQYLLIGMVIGAMLPMLAFAGWKAFENKIERDTAISKEETEFVPNIELEPTFQFSSAKSKKSG